MATYFIRETDVDLCDGCGKCLCICPVDAIVIEAEHAVIDKDWCIGCGLCVRDCPTGASKLAVRTDIQDRSPLPDFVTLHEQILKEKGLR